MKLEKLRNELENKIKELILEVLKDFDMSKYQIQIHILDNECFINILRSDIYITSIQYKNENYDFFMIYVFDEIYDFLKPSYRVNAFNHIVYTYESFLNDLQSEPVKIIQTLDFHKRQLETELKNILE